MRTSFPGLYLPLQGTVSQGGSCQGIGVHTGEMISLSVFPAALGTGITFVRKDRKNGEIAASWQNVVDTRFSTTLGNDQGDTIATVEHLLAAFWALGIDNARVEVTGPEIPILDGSSTLWIHFLQSLGVTRYRKLAPVIEILKEIRIQENSCWISVSPAETFSAQVTVPLEEGEPEQSFTYVLGDFFADQVAPARTFSLLRNIEKMRSMGLIRGGSLDNAVVLDRGRVLNPDGLRFPEECARHKVLDLIGDWSLGGRLILGAVKAHAPGHSLNHKLLRLLLEDESAWRLSTYKTESLQAQALSQAQAH